MFGASKLHFGLVPCHPFCQVPSEIVKASPAFPTCHGFPTTCSQAARLDDAFARRTHASPAVWGKNVDPSAGLLGKPAKTFMVCKFALQSLRQDSVGEDLWEKLQHHYWAVPQAPLCTHPPEPSSPTRVRFLGLGIVSATWAEVRCDEDPDLRTQHGLP